MLQVNLSSSSLHLLERINGFLNIKEFKILPVKNIKIIHLIGSNGIVTEGREQFHDNDFNALRKDIGYCLNNIMQNMSRALPSIESCFASALDKHG